jgi:hypothetical protein
MKNKDIQSILAGIAEEAAPSAEIDLWKGIRQRLETSESRFNKGETLMKPNFVQKPIVRRLALATLALVLAFAILFATPQGRAWAQEIIHFFTRAAGDTQPALTAEPLVWVNVTPGEPAPTATPRAIFTDCGDFLSPTCSMEQIRSKVNFPVSELGTIPAGLHFVGATGGPDRVWILYDNGKYTYGLSITEEPWTGSSELTQWKIGASAVVQTVQIGNVTGEYVRGGFVSQPGQVDQVWDPNIGIQTLHWINDGVFFDMSVLGTDTNIVINQDTFVALAAGLTTEPVSARITPMPATQTPVPVITFKGEIYNLSVSQAEEQAGFDVLEPGRLPEVLTLAGASYQSEQNIVRIFYIEQTPGIPETFGLTVSEELAPNTADCKLCSIVVGDYGDFLTIKSSMVVASDTIIETVQVGGFPGQYVEGQWGQNNSGWIWIPYPEIKTLRWQANGVAFELQYSGFSINNEVPISKADLIAIAESMMK